MIELDDPVCLVTGAASGIGRAIALRLAAAGGRVVVAADLNEPGVADTARRSVGPMVAEQVDITDTKSIVELRDRVLRDHGAPGVVVNAAGWDRTEAFLDTSEELRSKVVAVNYLGPVEVCHAFLEPMVAGRRRGKVINIASDAGRVGSSGETVYAGAKGGVIALTKSLAREMARYGINVNCVCPGPTDTPLFNSQPERIKESLVRAIPFRRLAQPDEIASAVLFFASDLADFITGQVLSVSGGLTMAG